MCHFIKKSFTAGKGEIVFIKQYVCNAYFCYDYM
jgi:hypothetical protein